MSDLIAWLTGLNMQGYTMEDGAEIEVFGVEVVPGEGDRDRINPLDIMEAAEYINILERAMIRVVEAKANLASSLFYNEEHDKVLDTSIEIMDEILGTDALVLVQQRRKEIDNG